MNIAINTEDKEKVRVHSCEMPEPMNATIVCLEMKTGNERRYRVRVDEGAEGRITVSHNPHFQDEKHHINSGMYLLQKGWIAILVPIEGEDGKYQVEIGFARRA